MSSTTTETPTGDGTLRDVDLVIGGMTCASCAARIEKKLNRIDGVAATVNFATEKARVRVSSTVSEDELIETVERTGYTAQVPTPPAASPGEQHATGHDHGSGDAGALRQRLLVSAALTVPVVLLAMVPAWQFRNWQWLSLVLAAPVVVWGGWPFHRATWASARHGASTMDTLVSVGTVAALGWSLYALFFGDAGTPGMRHGFDLTVAQLTSRSGTDAIYLEAAAGVTTFLLLGRWLEARAKREAGAALRALLELGAKDVSVLRPAPDGASDSREVEVRVPVAELVVGDRFVVRPGEKVATDGEVVSGRSALDTSLVTGESVPVEVGPDDAVTGSTVNTSGRLVVRATHVGADTRLAGMARLVEDAQNGKAAVQRLADRISGVFVPVVLAIALLTFVVWLAVGGGPTAAFTAAVAVLVVACPCALGLATPTALLVGTGRGAQLGILIRGPEVLESTRRVDTVVLDKTGTVTTGRMGLTQVVARPSEDADEVLAVAAAIEAGSEHPVAAAVVTGASARGDLPDVGVTEGFSSDVGLGVHGVVGGRAVVVGRPSLLADWSVSVPPELESALDVARERGETAVVVAWDGRARGVLAVADTVRETSADAVARLVALGLRPVLLTGDHASVARQVAARVGITDVVADVLPEDKVAVVARLQASGAVVAMVGDGVNDAAALAQADLGLAMGAGSDVAILASDLTLVRNDLRSAADAIRLSRRTLAVIKGNLFWAFAYNVAGIPLAALGLLNPMIAGGAMAFSSVAVVLNSLRLRRFR